MFVATNLLSKIGVIFLIVSVIAFSAASEGRLPDGVRLALVLAVGVIMLVVGGVFFKKGSVIFSNALMYGGVAELFICSLVGYHGLHALNDIGAVIVGVFALLAGVIMSRFAKSQAIMVITAVLVALPLFTSPTIGTVIINTVYLALANSIIAVVSRLKGYDFSMATGAACAFFQAISVCIIGVADETDFDISFIFAVLVSVFAFVLAFIYSSGTLLDSLSENGEMNALELALFNSAQGVALLFIAISFSSTGKNIISFILFAVIAVFYAIFAAFFSMKFHSRCKAASSFINLAFAALLLGALFYIPNPTASFAAVMTGACIALVFNSLLDRKLLAVWGYVLLGIAWFKFLFIRSPKSTALFSPKELSAIFINLGLTAALLVFYLIRKNKKTTWTRVYTCMAFVNFGYLGGILIRQHLVNALKDSGIWTWNVGRTAFSSLLCAVLWLLLGFAVGKVKLLKTERTVFSFIFYGLGFLQLGIANIANFFSGGSDTERQLGLVLIIVTIAVNIVSVLAVLDITVQIEEKAPKFSKAVGLIVSAYAIATLTMVLGTNRFVVFTSFIISIIYLVTAAAWIFFGFWKFNPVLRRFGLALALFSSAKLFLFDFRGIDQMGRTLLFIGFGITLLVISFAYGIAEKKRR